MTGSVQFALDKRAIVHWNFIYILETWNPPPSHCKQDSCNCEQDNTTYHLYFYPQINKKKSWILLFLQRYFPSWWTHFFWTRSSDITTVASGHFCGPLSNTFQVDGSRRHGLLTEIWTFEHSLNLHHSPGFLRCFRRNGTSFFFARVSCEKILSDVRDKIIGGRVHKHRQALVECEYWHWK